MAQIDLTPEETELLVDVVRGSLSELRMEIGHTDSVDFREVLKLRKEMLLRILGALGAEELETEPPLPQSES